MKIALLSLVVLISGLVNAAEVWHSSTIKSVYPLSDGSFVITFTTDEASSTTDCAINRAMIQFAN